jgi:anthranilate synthase/aminodeoxychorismate synthase-like glutamine amidotransferase
MSRLVILDNLDSFTYNLAQAFEGCGAEVLVHRASDACVGQIADLRPSHLVLSPGPQRPQDHPTNYDLLQRFAGSIPILGVCLGMQAINTYYRGTLRQDHPPVHGKPSFVNHDASALFVGVPNPFAAARYHSLLVDQLGKGLEATAWTEDRSRIMSIRHTNHKILGVQFHPESFMTPDGTRVLQNFLEMP